MLCQRPGLDVIDCGKTGLNHLRKVLSAQTKRFAPSFHHILRLHSGMYYTLMQLYFKCRSI